MFFNLCKLKIFFVLFTSSSLLFFLNRNLNGSRQVFPINENGLSYLESNKQDFNLLPSGLDSADSNALSVMHVGRTLLSDEDYDQIDSKETSKVSSENSRAIQNKSKIDSNSINELIELQRKELVNINNTWHFIDPNICANLSFFNRTHSIK